MAAIAARLEARRLSKPVEQLAVAVGRLGIGDFSVRTDRTGIPELDEAATALDATAERLGVLVERERSFSANASHQLRTPLTGIRIQLENALESPADDDHDQIADALGAVDRLETTISDLIELSRAHTPADDHVRIDALIEAQLPSWQVLASTSEPPAPLRGAVEPADGRDLGGRGAPDPRGARLQRVRPRRGDGHGRGRRAHRRRGDRGHRRGPGARRRHLGALLDRGRGRDDRTRRTRTAWGCPWPRRWPSRWADGCCCANRVAHPRFTLLLLAPDE